MSWTGLSVWVSGIQLQRFWPDFLLYDGGFPFSYNLEKRTKLKHCVCVSITCTLFSCWSSGCLASVHLRHLLSSASYPFIVSDHLYLPMISIHPPLVSDHLYLLMISIHSPLVWPPVPIYNFNPPTSSLWPHSYCSSHQPSASFHPAMSSHPPLSSHSAMSGHPAVSSHQWLIMFSRPDTSSHSAVSSHPAMSSHEAMPSHPATSSHPAKPSHPVV